MIKEVIIPTILFLICLYEFNRARAAIVCIHRGSFFFVSITLHKGENTKNRFIKCGDSNTYDRFKKTSEGFGQVCCIIRIRLRR